MAAISGFKVTVRRWHLALSPDLLSRFPVGAGVPPGKGTYWLFDQDCRDFKFLGWILVIQDNLHPISQPKFFGEVIQGP